jgi:hypothetical protein
MSSVRPGRRVAVGPARRFSGGAAVAAVLVALAVLLVLLAGPGAKPGDDAVQGAGVLVDQAVDGCAGFRPARGTSTMVSTGSAPVEGLPGGGSIRYGAPAEVATAEAQDIARGDLLKLDDAARGPESLVVVATGALAAGLFSFRADTGDDGTLAVTECLSPRATWWFTGAGATLDHSSVLVLSNLDPGAAVVDVRVLGPDGEVDTLGTRGITVPPAGRTSLALTDLAPQGEELAVQVSASRGRVVAAVSDRFAAGAGQDSGTDWVPSQSAASRVVRLAGLPGGASDHTLLVANPSEREALVEVEISGRNGSFAPTENAQVRVPAGGVVSTDISESVRREASTVTLRSPVPVTATVRSVRHGDRAYAADARPLTGPAAAPVPDDVSTTVQLTAGAQPATVRVTGFRADGTETETGVLEVAASATGTWSPSRPADYLVVVPQNGRAIGGVVYAGDTGLSQVPLHRLAVRVDRPVVRPVLH